ncbi:MAG: sigma-70 family RNA polymerase sigma factor [Candidatus Limnocylindria bacterium]
MNREADEQADLVRRARAGDGRAFESLARAEERGLYRHALRMLGTPSDAEDVVQDTLLSAWRSIGAFQGTSVRAWLFRIATNRAIDLLRARRRHGELPLEPPDDGDDEPRWSEHPSGDPELSEMAAGREATAIVEAALLLIPFEQRTALLLRDVEGFDYAEIGRITTSEIGTVKSRIHRGRVAVRNALVQRGWKGPGG